MGLRELSKAGLVVLPKDVNGRAIVSCAAAAKLEACGEYEKAGEVLSFFWNGPLSEPLLEGLTREAQLMLLLRTGSLTAWLGSKAQARGWSEAAKNLLTRSSELAIELSDHTVWLEAQRHLGNCYRREGNFNEAFAILSSALKEAPPDADVSSELAIALAIVLWSTEQYDAALGILKKIASAVNSSLNDSIKAAFHNGVAVNQKALSRLDEAIIEMTACSFHAEQAQHITFLIAAEINLGNLYVATRQYQKAHEHIGRAEELARHRGDLVHLAHSKDSRALAFFAERRYDRAEHYARQSVELLERGDDHAFLVSSLLTHARCLSKLGRKSQSVRVYFYAQEIAEQKISASKAAQIGVEMLTNVGASMCLESGLGYEALVKQFKEALIDAAMDSTGVTEAARRLGMDHQHLCWLLKESYPHLRRTPPRRRSIIRPISGKPAQKKKP